MPIVREVLIPTEDVGMREQLTLDFKPSVMAFGTGSTHLAPSSLLESLSKNKCQNTYVHHLTFFGENS